MEKLKLKIPRNFVGDGFKPSQKEEFLKNDRFETYHYELKISLFDFFAGFSYYS